MKKTYCDRCGKETNHFPQQNVNLPHYKFTCWRSVVPAISTEIDLCSDCIKEFERWLNSEVEE